MKTQITYNNYCIKYNHSFIHERRPSETIVPTRVDYKIGTLTHIILVVSRKYQTKLFIYSY